MKNDVLTSDIKEHRTLATVVFTDCVGFSARMSVDEDHTLDLIRRDLNYMKQVCGRYEGRVLKSTGDGLLMCFSSAVKAVECAVEIQRSITDRAIDLPPTDTLQHRIGIHLADIFITETDVMGNGVNIAARLQTAAEPGGICISQTVHDVVKANIQLETKYLGPRELKNIREVVPVYKILLHPEPADPEADVVLTLEQDRNLARIKKLIFYTCKNIWESDPARLDRLNLRDLLQDLRELAPTLDRLRVAFDTAVKTLSKPAEYMVIANFIITAMTPLYERAKEATPTISSLTDVSAVDQEILAEFQAKYRQIATELEQSGNQQRIKKLLYYVCRRRWENDLNQLDGVPFQQLIAEIHQLAPTLDLLRSTIQGFVQTLSKQAEYSLIANGLVAKLQRLYVVDKTSAAYRPTALATTNPANDTVIGQGTEAPSRYYPVARELERSPHLLRIKKLLLYITKRHWESNSARLEELNLEELLQELHQQAQTPEQLQTALAAVVKALSKPDEYRLIAQVIYSNFKGLYNENGTPASAPPSGEPASTTGLTSAPPVTTSVTPAPAVAPVVARGPAIAPPAPTIVAPPPNSGLQSPSSPSPSPSPEGASQPPQLAPDSRAMPQAPAEAEQQKAKPELSLFDFRLAVMKYANPLRTKILLFSALQQDFNFSRQDWLNLKTQDLDGLLRQLLGRCQTYTDMEAILYEAAQRLQDPDEYVQTATAVIKCLRPFFVHGVSRTILNNPTEATRINLDEFEETTLEFSHSAEEDEHTCQLLSDNGVPTGLLEPAPIAADGSTQVFSSASQIDSPEGGATNST